MKFLAPVVIALLSITTIDTNAAVIWDESIDGNSASFPSLVLQAGTNEILGTSRWAGDELDPFQFTERDWFNLELRDGLSIQSITTQIINPILIADTTLEILYATAMWTLQDYSYDFKWSEDTRIGEASPYFSYDNLPLSGFNNFILNQAAGLSVPGPFDLSWEYKVTIQVVESASVPEPSSLGLLSIALFAFWFSSRRLKTKGIL